MIARYIPPILREEIFFASLVGVPWADGGRVSDFLRSGAGEARADLQKYTTSKFILGTNRYDTEALTVTTA